MKSPIEISLLGAIRASVPANCLLVDDTAVAPLGVRLHPGDPRGHDVYFDLGSDEQSRLDIMLKGRTRHVNSHETYGPARGYSFDRILYAYADVPIATYKVDILLRDGINGGLLAVECDGHEWHDRTKQQAAYDRSRDRELLKLGIPTIRFTGSEIFHSAERCAVDVFEIAAATNVSNATIISQRIEQFRTSSIAGPAVVGSDGRCAQHGRGFGVLLGMV